jgi:Family of unknown function (DUF6308)
MVKPLLIPRPALTIEDPWAHVIEFFGVGGGSANSGAYDAYIASGKSPANRIITADVEVINSTLSARARYVDWAHLIKRGTLPELAKVDSSTDLFLTSDRTWRSKRVPERLEDLFGSVISRGIGIARSSKVLHIKRPRLIPICDSYVLRLMGIPDDDGSSVVALVQHLRDLRSALLPTLRDLRRRLRKQGVDRSLLRIADGLIWGSHPDIWIQRRQ